ncbi:ABC transporter substrate-binding protein [Photobacterium jeanii]|uniref:ABC transporter substrate-binding protein n=1 Tax=Photobacterium jeanii TaxID=858640 RepID=A0A178K3S8_9GAMM|nr:HTH-type transcriptional regulator SgrR [Photobacterium jeanii]OAN11414.1 ABC transporter substrate-binding protein [Photobacterium jeanii]PST90933.1 HTH-type transcriptional regulator SgrR [Photobacterium jeanii]
MSGQRLKTQFHRLYSHFEGKDSDTSLQEIAEILFCTHRNVRMVMNKMADKGWIDWQPAVGRGKLSRLIFHSTDNELQQNYARKLVAEGKLEPALTALNNDATMLAQLIQEQLGVSTQQGKQVVRLPYYRAFGNLDPLTPLRRSEQHLVRQIFSGLTRLDEKKGEVESDLAHHWEALSSRHWRFYLRPAVRFHNGKLLDTKDVIATLNQVKQHRLFRHLLSIDSIAPHTIDIHLKRDDVRLPYLLADHLAVIQPAEMVTHRDPDALPIGTGAYKLTQNDNQRVKLEAFDQYYGFRAMIDVVEIWILEDFDVFYLKPVSESDEIAERGVSSRLHLDEGCNYLLYNRQTGLANNQEWLHYFAQRFNTLAMQCLLDQAKFSELRLINAYGLLPGWAHNSNMNVTVQYPPTRRTVTIAHLQDHPVYPLIAEKMTQLLKQDGLKVKVLSLSTAEMLVGKHASKVDIWISGMSLTTTQDEAILPWLYSFDHLYRAMPDDEFAQLEALIAEWRSDSTKAFPANEIGMNLVQSHQIQPLFHAWLGVDNSGELQGMTSNSLGWFDFTSVWKKPNFS